jgi:hypothetical protein
MFEYTTSLANINMGNLVPKPELKTKSSMLSVVD